MDIAADDNRNQPIIARDDPLVPLAHFNILRLRRNEAFTSQVPATRPASCPPRAPSM